MASRTFIARYEVTETERGPERFPTYIHHLDGIKYAGTSVSAETIENVTGETVDADEVMTLEVTAPDQSVLDDIARQSGVWPVDAESAAVAMGAERGSGRDPASWQGSFGWTPTERRYGVLSSDEFQPARLDLPWFRDVSHGQLHAMMMGVYLALLAAAAFFGSAPLAIVAVLAFVAHKAVHYHTREFGKPLRRHDIGLHDVVRHPIEATSIFAVTLGLAFAVL